MIKCIPGKLLSALAPAALFLAVAAPLSAQSVANPSVVGNLRVAEGFKAELVYTVPRAAYGSWVGLTIDDKGRLIVTDQTSGLYRVTLPPAGSTAEVKVEPIEIDLGGAHGVLYAFNSLYVMTNERGTQGLYRVRDTDGDDKYDDVRIIRNLSGTGEHGVHSITLSPDGQSLFLTVGNASYLTQLDSSTHPSNVGNDNLLPNLMGFSDGQAPNGGYVVKTDPDGKHWELMNFGFRNPYDVSFNAEGELFTYDADMEWDLGTPWYRPTRVNHLINGADFGWRTITNKWPAYYFDSFGEVVNIGSGSPTGSVFGTGAKFPAKYQRALYISDWSWGKLYAIHLTPSGATYTGEVEEFVAGSPFPVSDVVISPFDGAMYMTVGGRSTHSALYRVTYVGTGSTAPAAPETRGLAERQLRHRLESFHGIQHESAIDTAWGQLSSQDRAIRYAARIALEWQDVAGWRERALNESDPRTAIASIAALARASTMGASHKPQTAPVPNPALQARMLASLDKINWASLNEADQTDLARAYTLVFTRTGRPSEEDRRRLATKFNSVFPARAKEINGLLSRLLVYLEAPEVTPKLVALLSAAPTQQEQIDYALQLRLQKAGWTNELRESYLRWFIHAYANYRGGNVFLRAIVAIRTGALETFTDAERVALKDVIAITPTQVSPLQRVVDRPFVKDYAVDSLAPAIEAKIKAGGRDFEAGRRLFGEVACAVCHGFGLEGGTVGPVLTGSGGRYTVRDLLESIIEPNKVISDQFAATEFKLDDGTIVTGRVANASADQISVSTNMFDYTAITPVPRDKIVSMEDSTTSMMPPGMINNLTEDQIADLSAYILSLNDPNGPMFKK